MFCILNFYQPNELNSHLDQCCSDLFYRHINANNKNNQTRQTQRDSFVSISDYLINSIESTLKKRTQKFGYSTLCMSDSHYDSFSALFSLKHTDDDGEEQKKKREREREKIIDNF